MKNLKKLFALAVSCIVLSSSLTAFAENDVTVSLNGKTLDFEVAPQIVEDVTMVPLRAIFEELGASVFWNDDDKSILGVKDNVIVMLQIGNNKLFINNSNVELETPPIIVSDRTLVPLRAIAESFDCTVDWNDSTKAVIITTN